MRNNKFFIVCLYSVFAVVLACNGVAHAAATYTNPVISEIGPADPTILLHDGVYYMYPTGDNVSYHVYTSTDLVNWNKGARVFEPGGINIWAPDVFYNEADGKFYLWYTADWKIGLAIATSPTGPFVDQGIKLHGYIDAHVFQDDDGQCYFYYTDLGHIYVHPMNGPGQLTGSPQVILEPSQDWEMVSGRVNEGPWMMKHNGLYYMLYSGTGADSPNYGVGYATATSPMGPFTKYEGNPIVHRGGGVYGPGHGAVTTDAAGNLWHIYHQKEGTEVDWNRFICIDPMWFDADGVLHSRATRGTVQQAPATVNDPAISAYWRFEDGIAGEQVLHGADTGMYSPDIRDVSGSGNHLSVWETSGGGSFAYHSDAAFETVPQTGAANNLSVKNTGGGPGMFTQSGSSLSLMAPDAFTIEATFKLEDGGHRSIVGRDSYGTAAHNPELAALYVQAVPGNALAIKFCDQDGYWHDAISAEDVFTSFDFGTNPDGEGVPWYSVAAVSDGATLSLYLLEHGTDAEYQLIAQTDMTASGSSNTALTVGAGKGGDWEAGNWSVGRGLYGGEHADRAWGFIDEVRIWDRALEVGEFVASVNYSNTAAYWRFEAGPADGLVGQVEDITGNGNDLFAWSDTLGAHVYRDEVPSPTMPVTKADNLYSVLDVDDYPGLFTSSADAGEVSFNIETWQPEVFTIEASFKPESGEHRTIVGRDGQSVVTGGDDLSALYFQIQPDDSVAIKFADVSGYSHEAVSAPGLIRYDDGGHWYHMAAVCDGTVLRLYLNDVDRLLGYQLVAETDISASGSPDRRLVADTFSSGNDWHGGGWTVGRGLFNGGHADRMHGYIDEVRISTAALAPSEFLFYEVYYAGIEASPSDLLVHEKNSTGGDIFFSLKSPPSGDVTLHVQEKNGRGQIMLSTTSLTFTAADWDVPQPIHVTAVDDSELENAEHAVPLSVTASSTFDPDYDGLQASFAVIKVADNECGAWGYAAGDFNRDCVVNISDLAEMAQYWLTCSEPGQSGCTDFFSN